LSIDLSTRGGEGLDLIDDSLEKPILLARSRGVSKDFQINFLQNRNLSIKNLNDY